MLTEVYWVMDSEAGRLGIAPRPRGGDWLIDEMRAWRLAGVDTVVSLLTSAEAAELELEGEGSSCEREGIRFHSFPIEDRGLPASSAAVAALADKLTGELDSGRSVVVHCRQGIGRSSLVAASVMVSLGENPEQVLDRIESVRGRPVPDTEEQRSWLKTFAKTALP